MWGQEEGRRTSLILNGLEQELEHDHLGLNSSHQWRLLDLHYSVRSEGSDAVSWLETIQAPTCGGRRRGGEEDVLQQQFLLIREAPSMVSCTRISSSLSGHGLEFLSL